MRLGISAMRTSSQQRKRADFTPKPRDRHGKAVIQQWINRGRMGLTILIDTDYFIHPRTLFFVCQAHKTNALCLLLITRAVVHFQAANLRLQPTTKTKTVAHRGTRRDLAGHHTLGRHQDTPRWERSLENWLHLNLGHLK